MKVELDECTLIELGASCTLRVPGGSGIEVVGVRGVIWVTEQGSRQDVLLAPGESMRLTRDGTALVTALQAGAVRLLSRGPAPGRSAWASFLERWSGWFSPSASRRHAERLWGI